MRSLVYYILFAHVTLIYVYGEKRNAEDNPEFQFVKANPKSKHVLKQFTPFSLFFPLNQLIVRPITTETNIFDNWGEDLQIFWEGRVNEKGKLNLFIDIPNHLSRLEQNNLRFNLMIGNFGRNYVEVGCSSLSYKTYYSGGMDHFIFKDLKYHQGIYGKENQVILAPSIYLNRLYITASKRYTIVLLGLDFNSEKEGLVLHGKYIVAVQNSKSFEKLNMVEGTFVLRENFKVILFNFREDPFQDPHNLELNYSLSTDEESILHLSFTSNIQRASGMTKWVDDYSSGWIFSDEQRSYFFPIESLTFNPPKPGHDYYHFTWIGSASYINNSKNDALRLDIKLSKEIPRTWDEAVQNFRFIVTDEWGNQKKIKMIISAGYIKYYDRNYAVILRPRHQMNHGKLSVPGNYFSRLEEKDSNIIALFIDYCQVDRYGLKCNGRYFIVLNGTHFALGTFGLISSHETFANGYISLNDAPVSLEGKQIAYDLSTAGDYFFALNAMKLKIESL